jgi:hypothetical protein
MAVDETHTGLMRVRPRNRVQQKNAEEQRMKASWGIL